MIKDIFDKALKTLVTQERVYSFKRTLNQNIERMFDRGKCRHTSPYYRVSTDKQRLKGRDMEAQRQAVTCW